MPIEQTLVLIKPDGWRRGLTGLVIDRLDGAGLELVGARLVRVTEALAREHYRDLRDKPFFPSLIRYIRGEFHKLPQNQVLALVYQGDGAIARVRQIAGATNPEAADPRSIRGAFGRVTTEGQFENVLHASGNAADAEREIKLWFRPDEILTPAYPTAAAANGKASEACKVWA